jgi:purine/pyrimidine-nucleoside phosphorylase
MKHNSYFEGRVQSLAVSTAGGPATVGVIEPGKYSFGTDCEEHMHVVAGTLNAKLPGGDWKSYSEGQHFVVSAKVKFAVEAAGDVAYLFYYKR